MTMGAEMVPSATSSLKRSPALWREPAPSQQMRAGRPWKWTLSLACWIQRARRSSSGKKRSGSRRLSPRCRQDLPKGQPTGMALPSQKSGLM